MLRQLNEAEIATSIKEIEIQGFTILKKILSVETLDYISAYLDKNHARADVSGVNATQAQDKYLYHLQNKDKLFLDIITNWHSGMTILKSFLNDPYYRELPEPECNFLLAYYNARSSVGHLPLHIDSYVPSISQYPNSMQIVYSISGQSEENGATFVVPGSHKSNQWPDRDYEQLSLSLCCDPGDVIIWDSRLWHGASKNVSGRDRWSLVATFRPWYMKQNFDPMKNISNEFYSKLTVEQKVMLGFLSLPPKDETEKVSLKEGKANLPRAI